MNKVSVYRDENDKWSAATAFGFLCQSVSRDDCEAAILAALDVTPGEVSLWLDSPADAGEFRAAWSQAVGATLVTLAAAIEQQSSDAEITQTLLGRISLQLEQLLAIWQRQESRERIPKIQAKLMRQLDAAKEQLAANGIDDATDEEIVTVLLKNGDRLAMEYQQLLRGQNNV